MINPEAILHIDYFKAVIWADMGPDSYIEGELGHEPTVADINIKCLVAQQNVVTEFLEKANFILENTDYSQRQAEHDFYLTRQGHGCGFWEADHCTEIEGEALTNIATEFGELDFYVGDDKSIYFS